MQKSNKLIPQKIQWLYPQNKNVSIQQNAWMANAVIFNLDQFPYICSSKNLHAKQTKANL